MDKKGKNQDPIQKKNYNYLPNIFLPKKLSQYCTNKTNTIQTLLNRGKSPFTPKLEIIFWKCFEFTKNYNDFIFLEAQQSGSRFWSRSWKKPFSQQNSRLHSPRFSNLKQKLKKNVSFSYTKKKQFLDPEKFPFQQPALVCTKIDG